MSDRLSEEQRHHRTARSEALVVGTSSFSVFISYVPATMLKLSTIPLQPTDPAYKE